MGTTGQSITLANSIIGVGILAMPFCFQQCGVLLATLILLFMGLVSRLCCYFLLKSALLARRRNFEFLAFHVFGSAGKMAVEVGIIGFLMGTCIAYFVVVGDLGPQIIAKMFNINQSDILRDRNKHFLEENVSWIYWLLVSTTLLFFYRFIAKYYKNIGYLTCIMVIVSLVCVLPLGLLRNVDSLSNVSAATIGFYFCLVIKVIAEAATQLVTSDWHRRVEMWRPAGLLQCVPIFSMALFCQTQLFEIFESLPTLSLEKMNVVTKNAINICTGVYFTLGVFGYIAFCLQDISGNILMSLSPTMANDVIKLGFVMSVAFSFPLIIFPCRASLYSFLYKKVHSSQHDHIINHSIPETTFRCITVAIIAVALFISLLIPNIELVLGLVGSTIGVLICIVFPAACFINVTFKDTNERLLAKCTLVLGLIIMVLGTYANLEAAGVSSKVDRYEEKFTQERIDKIVEDFFEKRDKDEVIPNHHNPNKIEPVPVDQHLTINKNIIKESEVQPPNPVPPESQSNEKLPEIKQESMKAEEKKIVPVLNIEETAQKISDSHPKNLQKPRLEAVVQNGNTDTEPVKPKEVKPQSNEDKIDIIKQQELIETIKQHGEEQKELMKEQKEILDEIIKTKKELAQNKNEADTNEAKKIALESIKQIANMAIQSLGGVTEKPVQTNDNKKIDRLEKLTNEAVQEIAKKAVETIEAIKDIKESPDESKVVKEAKNTEAASHGNSVQNKDLQAQKTVQSQISPQNIQPSIKPNTVQQGMNPPDNPPKIVSQDIQPQALKRETVKSENSPVLETKVETQNLADVVNPPANVLSSQSGLNSNNEIKPVVNDNMQINNAQNRPLNKANQHLHSQDEPQSYKQGEDAKVNEPKKAKITKIQEGVKLKQPEVKIDQNVPLAVAMNDLLSSKQIQEKEAVAQQLNEDIKVNLPQKIQSNDNARPVKESIMRQKREVVDCTQKVDLAPKDKEICDTLVDRPKDMLPQVDIDKIALPKDLPMDVNALHHLVRSLKSYDKDQT